MRPREPRRNVLIKARMRVGASWSDICIRNTSSRGLLVQAGTPPQRGTYVEVRRGPSVIVARCVWVREDKCGLRTQERVTIDEINSQSAKVKFVASTWARPGMERRSPDRASETRHDQNRMLARISEFAVVVSLGGFLAYVAAASLQEAFARPISVATAAIGGVN